MTPEMRRLLHATEVIAIIQARLERAGAVIELQQLAKLSVDELDLLVRQEMGLGCSSDPQDTDGTLAA